MSISLRHTVTEDRQARVCLPVQYFIKKTPTPSLAPSLQESLDETNKTGRQLSYYRRATSEESLECLPGGAMTEGKRVTLRAVTNAQSLQERYHETVDITLREGVTGYDSDIKHITKKRPWQALIPDARLALSTNHHQPVNKRSTRRIN